MAAALNTLYLLSAVVGGTILVIQTILLVAGTGGDADVDTDVDPGDVHAGDVHGGGADAADHAHEAYAFFKGLSFKTLVAFVTFFGLAGLAAAEGGMGSVPTLIVAVAAGAVALYIVAYLMAALSRLQSKGNVDLRNAVGQQAKVYLKVPAAHSGQGKVMVSVQGRTVELKAVTEGAEIPTGAEVRVVGTSASDTVEVLPVERS